RAGQLPARDRLAPELAAGIVRVKSAKSIGPLAPTGPGAPERAGHPDHQGTRPPHHRRAARLRPAPVPDGGAHRWVYASSDSREGRNIRASAMHGGVKIVTG